MDVKQKLDAFAKIMENEAEKKRLLMLRELDDKMDSAIAGELQQAKQKASDRIKSEKQKVTQYKNKEITFASNAAKVKLINKRLDIENKVFDGVKAKLTAYMQTSDYTAFLSGAITTLVREYGNADIWLSASDMDKADELKKQSADLSSVNFTQSDENIFGGFKAHIPAKNIMIDRSFKTKIEDEKTNFSSIKISM